MNNKNDEQWLHDLRAELIQHQDPISDSVRQRLAQIRRSTVSEYVEDNASAWITTTLGWLTPKWQSRLAGAALLSLGCVLLVGNNTIPETSGSSWSEPTELLGDDLSLHLWLTDGEVDNDLLGG